LTDGAQINCTNTWIIEGKKHLSPRILRELHKMVIDIQNQNGIIQATILPFNSNTLSKAKEFLIGYADKFNFGSHDALVAGTAEAMKELNGSQLCIVTSDRGFKAALYCAGIPYFDPNEND
jgi:hypothetical protein